MSAPIQGSNQTNQPATTNVGNKQALNDVKAFIQEASSDAMIALQDLSEELAGKVTVKKDEKKETEKLDQKQHANKSESTEELAADMAAAVQAQDELEKKKRKKKKFEEKLKHLGSILSQIDPKDLDEDEKKELETFNKNLKTMNKFNRELELYSREEDYLESLINQHSSNGESSLDPKINQNQLLNQNGG